MGWFYKAHASRGGSTSQGRHCRGERILTRESQKAHWEVRSGFSIRSPEIRYSPAIGRDLVGYNDLRAALGLEFIHLSGFTGLFEVGVVFEREIRYRSQTPPVFYPNTTMFLHTGLAY